MDDQVSPINNHNDRQKFSELECSRRWLKHYNALNQTGYCCLKANYFQSEVDIYIYRIDESGQPLRLQITKAGFSSLTATIKRKKNLYSPKQKADLFLLIDFATAQSPEKINDWQKKHLGLLADSGFLEVWLVGYGDLVVNLWPGNI